MAAITDIGFSALTTPLQQILTADAIQPGSPASYELCKLIYLYHPLGSKCADGPINMALSQPREIVIPDSPEERIKEAFLDEWKKIKADFLISSLAGTARTYGIASIIIVSEKFAPDQPIPPDKLYDLELSFNVLDPLNTAGSMVTNQDPNAPDFQKITNISAAGVPYHRQRSLFLMHERPIYIAYEASAFGYVGRSVYQRALYPMKSFIQSMRTDDMVTRKAGLLIAKLQSPGSIIDNIMQAMAGIKRNLLKEGETDNVLSIGLEEGIESLNLQNIDGASSQARKNVLENIAAAMDMPAKILNNETFAEGFGEGTEDAKNLARYIQRIREWMEPAYSWFDAIVQHRAWNPDFYRSIQAEFPQTYAAMTYNTAFYQWRNSFRASWPNLMIEPESERAKTDDVRNKALIASVQVLLPELDPENKAIVLNWFADNMNDQETLFPEPLQLDAEALQTHAEDAAEQQRMQQEAMKQGLSGDDGEGDDKEPNQPKPFAAAA